MGKNLSPQDIREETVPPSAPKAEILTIKLPPVFNFISPNFK
jgi:hypothetical protein